MEDTSTIRKNYPRPIAWEFSELSKALDPVARFSSLMSTAEKAVRYLALTELARYLDLHETQRSPEIDHELGGLRRGNFGDWSKSLSALDRFLSSADAAPLGVPLGAQWRGPAVVDFARLLSGVSRMKVTPLAFIQQLVELRNDEAHHRLSEEQRTGLAKPLERAVVELLIGLPRLAQRTLLFVQGIDYVGPQRYVVHLLKLMGTERPTLELREVRDPQMLGPDRIFLWSGGNDSAQLITPLMHFQRESGALFLLSRVSGGVPEYTSIEQATLLHHPDNLMSTFHERAAFLLEAPAEIGGASPRRDTYASMVAQVVAAGKSTPEELNLLRTLRSTLGVSDPEARALHEELGLDELVVAPASFVKAPAARGRRRRAPSASDSPARRPAVSIATIEDVIDWGWDGVRLLEELVRLDYQTIHGLNEGNEGMPQQWAPVFMEHPDTWRLAVEGPERIVGYWHFVPLFDDDYALASSGHMLDGQITADRVCYLELPGVYKVYFVSICLLPKYRGLRNFRILLDALFDDLAALAERGVYFDEICANAFTGEGRALCRTLGMRYVGDHQEKGEVFTLPLIPVPNLRSLQAYPRFIECYASAKRQ